MRSIIFLVVFLLCFEFTSSESIYLDLFKDAPAVGVCFYVPVAAYPAFTKQQIRAVARKHADRYDIPYSVVLKMIWVESRYDNSLVSPKGAVGLMQLMPETAALLGVDPRDPNQNIRGGVRYLAFLLKQFGSMPLALAAYNAGPSRVIKYGGIPPYKETQNYVSKILE